MGAVGASGPRLKILVDDLCQANSRGQLLLLHEEQRVRNVDAGVYARITATWTAQLNIENSFKRGVGPRRAATTSRRQPRTFRVKVTANL